MSRIRVGLAPLEHRNLSDAASPAWVAAGETAVFVRRYDEAEPRHYFAPFIIFVVLAKHAHNVLAHLESYGFDVQPRQRPSHVALALYIHQVVEFNGMYVFAVHKRHLLYWVLDCVIGVDLIFLTEHGRLDGLLAVVKS